MSSGSHPEPGILLLECLPACTSQVGAGVMRPNTHQSRALFTAPPSTCACRRSISDTRPRTRLMRSASTPSGGALKSFAPTPTKERAACGSTAGMLSSSLSLTLRMGSPSSRRSSSTTSAGGADFRTPTKAPIMSTSASGLAFRFSTAPNSSRMTAALCRLSSNASSGRWRASTAELSAKVFAGQCRLIEVGYRQGGPAGFGLRRMLVDEKGAHKGVLVRGEHNSIQTDRVILVPGEPVEIEMVQWMYRAFVDDGHPEAEIASLLQGRGVPSEAVEPWTRPPDPHQSQVCWGRRMEPDVLQAEEGSGSQ